MAVELLKLVSGSERELMDNRSLLGRGSRLVRREVVSIDFPAGERELVAEASLAAWAHEKMLVDSGDGRGRARFSEGFPGGRGGAAQRRDAARRCLAGRGDPPGLGACQGRPPGATNSGHLTHRRRK